MQGVKGLNRTESSNTFKFEVLSQRLQRINVDVIHRVHHPGSLDAAQIAPDSGEKGCYFQDELERLKELEKTPQFKRFYYNVWPLVQSLAELIHNLPNVVTYIEDALHEASIDVIHNYFQLLAVLARDIQDDLYPYLHRIVGVLCNLVDKVSTTGCHGETAPNPELVGKLFECMSHLLKHQVPRLVSEPDCMRKYYGLLLGHPISFVRDYAAQCFSILLRKLSAKSFRVHIRKVLQASALQIIPNNVEVTSLVIHPVEGHIEFSDNVLPKRSHDLLNGIALWLFYTCKGVQDCLHSKGGSLLSVVFDMILPGTKTQPLAEDIKISKKKNKKLADVPGDYKKNGLPVVYITGLVLGETLRRLFRHIHPSNAAELWLRVLHVAEKITMFPNCESREIASMHIIEILKFCLMHSNKRGISDAAVYKNLSARIGEVSEKFVEFCFQECTHRMVNSTLELYCNIWQCFPQDDYVISRLSIVVQLVQSLPFNEPYLLHLAKRLTSLLPMYIIEKYMLKPLLKTIVSLRNSNSHEWLAILLQLLLKLRDNRIAPCISRVVVNDDARHGDAWNLESDDDMMTSIDQTKYVDLSRFKDDLGSIVVDIIASAVKEKSILAAQCLLWFCDCYPEAFVEVPLAKDIVALHKSINIKDKTTENTLLVAYNSILVCSMAEVGLSDNDVKAYYMTVIKELISIVISVPKSIALQWALYSTLLKLASLSQEKYVLSVFFDADMDRLCEALLLSVASPSFWLRITTLRILTFVRPPTITVIVNNVEERQECDVIGLCLLAASVPADISTEREYNRHMSQLGVLTRDNKLSCMYMQLVCAFCLGQLHYKFMPFWEPAAAIIINALQTEHSQDKIWLQLLSAIEVLNKLPVELLSLSACSDDEALLECDSGDIPIPLDHAQSSLFYYQVQAIGRVDPDARADINTVFCNAWDILRKCPSITLRKSKIVVPMFLSFLRDQYYNQNFDDPELCDLLLHGVISKNVQPGAVLPLPILKSRLVLYLKVFAAVTSPKQLYQHQLLYRYYCIILAKPECVIAKLALQCILTYKSAISSYAENFQLFLEEKSFRDQLLLFDPRSKSGTIDESHRDEVVPALIRLVFGRMTSAPKGTRSTREQTFARRNAVLSFLSKFPPPELRHFIYLLIRGIVPRDVLLESAAKSINMEWSTWYASTWVLLEALPAHNMSISWDRQMGFLYTLEQCIKVLGFSIAGEMESILMLVSKLFQHAQHVRVKTLDLDKEEYVEERETDYQSQNINKAQAIRTLCLQRFTDIVNQYHESIDMVPHFDAIWSTCTTLITALPSSIMTTTRAPALLTLIHSLSQHENTYSLISSRDDAICGVLSCVATQRVDLSVVRIIMDIIQSFLIHDGGNVIKRHAEMIITCFSRRFVPGAVDYSTVKLSELDIRPTGSIKEELRILSLIAETIFKEQEILVAQHSVANLATMLLGMIRTCTSVRKIRVEEEWMLNVLRIYKTLLWRIDDVSVHVPFISRLFGPPEMQGSIFNLTSVRHALIETYESLSMHHSTQRRLVLSASALKKLNVMDVGLTESRDFSECIPVLKGLSETNHACYSWSAILGYKTYSYRDASIATAVIYECLKCMHDKEMVVRTGALCALKCFVSELSVWECNEVGWIELLKNILVPAIHKSLKRSTDAVLKGFISLLRHMVEIMKHSADEAFHPDLHALMHVDPEQDFFENIIHIQLHRRVRCMMKLRNMITQERNNLTIFSMVHVILPLSMYPLLSHDFTKNDHQPYLTEAAGLVGGTASLLPWSKYYGLIKMLLKCIKNDKLNKEKILLVTLCAVLDGYHFNAYDGQDADSSDDSDVETKQERIASGSVENRSIVGIILKSIIPSVKMYMLKEGKDHTGNKTKTARPMVAVALTKLLRNLPSSVVAPTAKKDVFVNLVMNVVSTLKSRDSDARDAARESLGKMVKTLGVESIGIVLQELKHTLSEGYQRHVCNYTVRWLLNEVLQDYFPPAAPSLISDAECDISQPHFDTNIPLIMECVMDDMIGITKEQREVEGVTKTVIREAKGNKAYDTLEICASKILFRPTYALKSAEMSSVHALISPLLEALQHPECATDVQGRIGEALQRISTGLAKNPSVTPAEMFLYVHSTLHPYVEMIVREMNHRSRALGKLSASHPEDEDVEIPAYLRDESDDEDVALGKKRKHEHVTGDKISTWLPFDKRVSDDQRLVIAERDRDRRALVEVQDGASAPKLTGRNKYVPKKQTTASSTAKFDTDIAFTSAVKFCLSLLLSCMKQNKLNIDDEQTRSMAIPFFPLLAQCLRLSGSSKIVMLAMRCICTMLSWGLPVDAAYSQGIGRKMLGLLFRGGALISTDNELVQSCLKGLTSLFNVYAKQNSAALANIAENTAIEKDKLPLAEESIRTLLSMLSASILDITSTYQNTAFQFIRSVLDARIVVPEVYDLITQLMEQVVTSHRKGIRDASAGIIVSFLLNYPLGDKRLLSHFKQLVRNCGYEYEEGRIASLELLQSLCRLVPSAVLDGLVDYVFLPMTLQLTSDVSSACRVRASEVIITMVRRTSTSVTTKLQNMAATWIMTELTPSTISVVRTGSQVASLLITGRPDLYKKAELLQNMIVSIDSIVRNLCTSDQEDALVCAEGEGDGGSGTEWSVLYHTLILLEKMYSSLLNATDSQVMQRTEFMENVFECLVYPHAWVRAVASRIVAIYLRKRYDGVPLHSGDILAKPNCFYHIARRLCIVLNQYVLAPSVISSVAQCLAYVIHLMRNHPSLDKYQDDEEGNTLGSTASKWTMQRLKGMGANPKGGVRSYVIEVFLLLVAQEESAFVSQHAAQMIEVALRAQTLGSSSEEQADQDTAHAAVRLLDLIEKSIGSAAYIEIYGEMQKKIEKVKVQRKMELATEAITNPKKYAQRKLEHATYKKEALKRKNTKHALVKGGKRRKTETSFPNY